MQGLEIVATGRALPEKCVTNEDLSKIVDTNDEWIRSRTGISQRYQCITESTDILATRAAMKALEESGIDKNDIGIVLVATTTPEYAFPSTACLVQKNLGLSKEVISFDINAACAGFLYGLGIVRGMLTQSNKPYALVIGSEHLSKIIDYTDRGSCILFGDGAGAAIVRKSDKLFSHFGWTDGNKDFLYCHGLGSREEDKYLHMEGNQVFRFAVGAISEGIDAVLNETKLSIDEIDYIVCHQANGRIIDYVEKKYKGKKTRFYRNIEFYGNTSAASIPICIDEMREKGLLNEGNKVIMVGFGAGFTWSSALITI